MRIPSPFYRKLSKAQCRAAFAIASVLLILGMSLAWFFSSQSQPSYQGKLLVEWLDDLAKNNLSNLASNPTIRQEALEAFRLMGKTAVPFLASIMEQQPKTGGLFQELLPSMGDALGRFNFMRGLSYRLSPSVKLWGRKRAALVAIEEIGPEAEEAIQAMIKELHFADFVFKSEILRVMGMISPGSKYERQVVEILVHHSSPGALTELMFSNLGNFPNQADLVVPVLIEGLTNNQFSYFRELPLLSIRSLNNLGAKAHSAIPHLLTISTNQAYSVMIRSAASNALNHIQGKTALP